MDVLSVQNLTKSFQGSFYEKKKQVLFDISFKVPEKMTTGFVGNNGSGKTTSIKCVFEFIRRDSGDVLFFGEPLSPQIKKRIGYLPERPYLYEFLTGMEFLKFHWNLAHVDPKKDFFPRAHSVLKTVGLYEARDRHLRNYSKGMLQRIGLAQSLIHEPDFLILDEPMSGLDPDGRIMVKDILRLEQKRGVSIFFSSHLLQDMEELCQHLVVIHLGKILYNGELTTFVSRYPSLEEAFRSTRKELT